MTYFSTAQAAAMIGVTRRTVNHWIEADKIRPPARVDHHGWRIWTLGEIRNTARRMGRDLKADEATL